MVVRKGTLIIVAPSTEGLVIVADRLESSLPDGVNADLSYRNDVDKIFHLEEKYGFAITGANAVSVNLYSQDLVNTYSFIPSKLIRKIHEKEKLTFEWSSLCRLQGLLIDDLKAIAKHSGYPKKAKSQIIMFGYSHTKNDFEFASFKIGVNKDGSPIRGHPQVYSQDVFQTSTFIGFGVTEHHDWKSTIFDHLLEKPQVISIAKEIFKKTANKSGFVGDIVDVVVVNATSFRWIERASNVS